MEIKNVDEIKSELQKANNNIKLLKEAEQKYYYLKNEVEKMDIDEIEAELCYEMAKRVRLTYFVKKAESKKELEQIEEELTKLKAEEEFLWVNLSDKEDQMGILEKAAEVLENDVIDEEIRKDYRKTVVLPLEADIENIEAELFDIEEEIKQLKAKKEEIKELQEFRDEIYSGILEEEEIKGEIEIVEESKGEIESVEE